MERSLFINDKEYISVPEAADLVGRNEAYINQLIRGKWVAASSVHGEYFIDVEALVRFMRMLEEEQAAMKAGAAEKVELAEEADNGWLVLSQTGAVVLTGLLFGVLVWTMIEQQVTLAQLRASMVASTAAFIELIFP